MDIEATMNFILECQARAEARAEKADARMEKADARAEKADARMEKHEAYVKTMEKRFDKRMDAISKLLQQGMRMQVENAAGIAELRTSVKELTASQKETDRELKAFIKSLRNGRNGRNGH